MATNEELGQNSEHDKNFDIETITIEDMLNKDLWCMNNGNIRRIVDLDDSHLKAIIKLYDEKYFAKNFRAKQEKRIRQELLRRTTKAGKVLYDNRSEEV